MSRALASLVLLGVAAVARAGSPDDAAHRADRARTQQLNRQAAAASAGRHPATPADAGAGYARAQSDYRQAQADYARDLDAGRRQMADCRAGHWESCGQ